MTFAQRRNRLTTHFSERIPVFKRRMNVSWYVGTEVYGKIGLTGEGNGQDRK